MNGRGLVIGMVFGIPDDDRGWYYACVSAGGDFTFLDYTSKELEEPRFAKPLLRLFISTASIKRAAWKKLGKVWPHDIITEHSRYRREPVGAPFPYIDLIGTGQSIEARNGEADDLELSAVWDAQEHIPPILRYHFFREEGVSTQFLIKKITAKL